jgi:2-polyprenyl-6-methoxyphenol hydroxylase and related FAD-dependent oxidoreductases
VSGQSDRYAVIVGAGLSGSLMALYLARRGWRVDVYERRGDPRLASAEGRSINLGLSARGMRALAAVGLLDAVLARSVPMRGRYIHTGGPELAYQPYGTRAGEVLYSILRADLNRLLIDHAEAHPAVRFTFGQGLTALEPEKGIAYFQGGATVHAPLIIGADGANSAVRGQLEQHGLTTTSITVPDWGYKELTIPPADDGSARTPLEGLHVWPGGGHGLMVAHPNVENSFTATLFLPERELSRLDTREAVAGFLAAYYPDTLALMPDGVDEWLRHPVGHLITVRTRPWHHKGVVLIGDAAHAVYPFYGQGMNSSFEDCLVLDQCLTRHAADLPRALAEYERLRKRHTDVLAELSERNFVELRDKLRSPWFRLRKQVDLVLHRLLGPVWLPLYTMVSHRAVPYATARLRARLQELTLLTLLGLAVIALPLLLLR